MAALTFVNELTPDAWAEIADDSYQNVGFHVAQGAVAVYIGDSAPAIDASAYFVLAANAPSSSFSITTALSTGYVMYARALGPAATVRGYRL